MPVMSVCNLGPAPNMAGSMRRTTRAYQRVAALPAHAGHQCCAYTGSLVAGCSGSMQLLQSLCGNGATHASHTLQAGPWEAALPALAQDAACLRQLPCLLLLGMQPV